MFAGRTSWQTGSNPVYAKLQELRSQGERILDLTVSNPTGCGFDYLQPPLLEAFQNPRNLSYTPEAHGLLPAREAVAAYYAARGIEVSPEQIFLTASTSEAYGFVFRLLAEPGDRILAPQPSYPLLGYLAGIHDVTPEPYALDFNASWAMNWGTLETPAARSARALMLVHPNNPTGHYTGTADRERVLKYCGENPMALLVDEVFLDYPLDSSIRPQSFAGTDSVLTFTLSGISKILGLPQMKLSWIVVSGPSALREEAIGRLEILSDTYLSVSAPPQNALPVWMKSQRAITDEIVQRVRANYRQLQETPGIAPAHFLPAEGGWYAVLNLPGAKDDEAWALEFLEKDRVYLHPGYLFDFLKGSHGVISLLAAPDIFAPAVTRLAARLR